MIETLLNMQPATLLTFLAAGVMLNLTPGADVIFASASGVAGGWRAGVAAAMGITLGAVVHIGLAAVGISAVVMATPWAYDAIRYLGAGYLVFLAIKTWRAQGGLGGGTGARHLSHALRRGFLTNVLNPKVALFVLAFLPQFTAPEAGPIWHQILILGAIFATTGMFINAGYGALAGLAGTTLTRASRTFNKLTALVFGGLAARLLLD